MEARALFDEGTRLQRQGALADAADRYARVLLIEPQNADALHRLAQVACQQGEFTQGIAYARQALGIDGGRARTHLLLGMALARCGALALWHARSDSGKVCADPCKPRS